jgi:oxygen-independent coproporphyrinogen-3 oxidase
MVATVIPTPGTPSLEFDAELVRKLAQLGPRYTSYPTMECLSEAFGYRDYLQTVVGLRARGSTRPLSLYVHIPFCESVCHYCSCNKIVTRDRGKAATYLSYLKHEIEMQGKLFAGMNHIEKLHIGGGHAYLSERYANGRTDDASATLVPLCLRLRWRVFNRSRSPHCDCRTHPCIAQAGL